MTTSDSHLPRTTEVEIRASTRSVRVVTNHSPPEEKISLFRSLFPGRDEGSVGANSDYVDRSKDSRSRLPASCQRALRPSYFFSDGITFGMLKGVSELIQLSVGHAESRAGFTPA